MEHWHSLWQQQCSSRHCPGLEPAAAVAAGMALLSALILVYVMTGLKQPLAAAEPEAVTSALTRNGHWGRIGLFMLLGMAAITPELLSSDWSAFRIRDDLEQSNQLASFGFVVFGSGMMVGRLGGDEVMHRFGQTRTLYAACAMACWASPWWRLWIRSLRYLSAWQSPDSASRYFSPPCMIRLPGLRAAAERRCSVP
ncbi:MAG: hypothetical protein R3E95_03010 [Thiolinea sp.]